MKYEIKENKLIINHQGYYTKKTIGDFLDDYKQSKKNKYLLIQNHNLFLNDSLVKNVNQIINEENIILIIDEQPIDWVMSDKECKVVYEDDFVYIVHKEDGYIIHGDVDDCNCLNAQAATYQFNHHINQPVRPIHRLDKDTTGLVLYSKIPFFQPWFDDQLSQKKIKRYYLATCFGNAKVGQTFTINQAIGKDRHINNKYRISSNGKPSITHFECIKVNKPYVTFKCTLETGRTHQIRVHLSSNGYPIVNDAIYGKPTKDYKHMGLWAYELEYRNPITHKKHKIKDYLEELK